MALPVLRTLNSNSTAVSWLSRPGLQQRAAPNRLARALRVLGQRSLTIAELPPGGGGSRVRKTLAPNGHACALEHRRRLLRDLPRRGACNDHGNSDGRIPSKIVDRRRFQCL